MEPALDFAAHRAAVCLKKPAHSPLPANWRLAVRKPWRLNWRLGPAGGNRVALLAGLVLGLPLVALAKLNVVATLPDLGALAQEIGGDHVQVTSLASGMEDPHFVDPKPSFIRVLNRADVLIEGGAELEMGWLPPLVNNARNPKILGNAPGHVLAASSARLIEVPSNAVDRSQGDVHRLGNPHFLLDPENAKRVAALIASSFGTLDPSGAGDYQANLKKFQERVDGKLAEWTAQLAPYRGTKVLTYHKSFDYLLERFGLVLVGTIEPKPGIEPSPSHINALVPLAKQSGVKLVILEPNRPRRTPQRVAESVGAKVVIVPLMVGGDPRARDYFAWYDDVVARLANALKPSP
jgi:zinc/manganese transport system substrate-binding protein